MCQVSLCIQMLCRCDKGRGGWWQVASEGKEKCSGEDQTTETNGRLLIVRENESANHWRRLVALLILVNWRPIADILCSCLLCYTWKQLLLSAHLSHRNSVRSFVRPSVCLSVTWVDQAKTVQARITKFSPSAARKILVNVYVNPVFSKLFSFQVMCLYWM